MRIPKNRDNKLQRIVSADNPLLRQSVFLNTEPHFTNHSPPMCRELPAETRAKTTGQESRTPA